MRKGWSLFDDWLLGSLIWAPPSGKPVCDVRIGPRGKHRAYVFSEGRPKFDCESMAKKMVSFSEDTSSNGEKESDKAGSLYEPRQRKQKKKKKNKVISRQCKTLLNAGLENASRLTLSGIGADPGQRERIRISRGGGRRVALKKGIPIR